MAEKQLGKGSLRKEHPLVVFAAVFLFLLKFVEPSKSFDSVVSQMATLIFLMGLAPNKLVSFGNLDSI